MEKPTQTTDKRMRAIFRDGHRLGIRLEPEAWVAVDLIASRLGTKWQEWAGSILDGQPDAPNATAVIRSAAMQTILEFMATGSEFAPGAEIEHPMLNDVVPVDRNRLVEELAASTIEYSADLGSFILHAVHRHVGGPALIFENRMIDQLSIIISKDQ